MSLSEEAFYFPFYLFNAVLEYIYFVTIHIQNNGPKSTVDIQRHLKFYKHEVTKFVHTFHGKDEIEKCANMLCCATPIFYSCDGMVYLSKNFLHFKQLLYEELILSYTTDIVLRGTKNISEVCKLLNSNSLININHNALMSILKQYSFFYEDKNKSLIILPYNWLDNFYQASAVIEKYFLHILQNVHVMSYDEVILHSDFIPSCGIHSYLNTFCILVASPIFKCRNNKVYLNVKGKRMKSLCQKLNIVRLDTDPLLSGITTSLLVSLLCGEKVHNWIGEVGRVMKNCGLIYCTVYFKDSSSDLFVIYFHKRALKSISEIQNLSNYISLRDVVMFDAVHRVGFGGRYWQATKLEIVKQSFKQNLSKYAIDVDEYKKCEYIPLELHADSESICKRKCCCKYCKSEKTLNFSSECIPNRHDEFIDFLKKSFNFSDSELNLYSVPNQIENIDNHVKGDTNKLKNSSEAKTKRYTNNCDLGENRNLSSNNSVDRPSKTKVVNLLVSHYTFVLGEIESVSKDFGIINGSSDYNSYTVYFLKNVLVSLDDFVDLEKIKKFNRVLAIVPNINEDNCLVASLVFLLNSREVSVISNQKMSPSRFVFEYFVPRIKAKCTHLLCYFNLSHILTFDVPFDFGTNKVKEIRRISSMFLRTLTELCNFDAKTEKKFQNFMSLASKRNWKSNKSFSTVSSFFQFIFSSVNKNKPNCKSSKKCLYFKHISRKNEKKHAFHHIQYGLNSKLCTHKISSTSDYENNSLNKPVALKISNSKNYLILSVDQDSKKKLNTSCSSLGSYFSCLESSCIESSSSYLSDDSFYSCSSSESLNCSSVDLLKSAPVSPEKKRPLCLVSHSNSLPLLNQHSSEKPLNSIFQSNISQAVGKLNDVFLKKLIVTGMCANEKPKHSRKLSPMKVLKMREIHKCRQEKRKLQYAVFCRNSFIHGIETVARVCLITSTSLFFIPGNNRTLTLCFPKKLIPVKIQSNIRINSVVKITYIPCVPLNLSHVILLETDF